MHLWDRLTSCAGQLAEARRLWKEAEDKAAKEGPHITSGDGHQEAIAIRRPKGEAGDKKNGFNLREAMMLGEDEQKELYDAIQVCGD
jgi:hypothetical protein